MKTYSFFIKLLISLTLLLVLPVSIIETISNYQILKYSEDEISNYGIGKLKVAENILIQLQDTVFNDSVKLSVNNIINGFGNYNNSIDMTDVNNKLYVVHILDALAELPKINNKYKSIYLYLNNFNYAFTSDYDFIEKDMLPDTGWLKYYDDYRKNKTALSMLSARIPSNNTSGIKSNSVDEFVISYIYPLTQYTTNLNGALVINLKERAISNLINSSNKNTEGYIFIVNQDGEIISHPNIKMVGTNISENDYLKNVVGSKSEQGHLISSVDKNKSLVSYYKSNFNNWTFIGIFPLDALTSKANTVRLNTIYIYLIIILVGIVVAYIISRKIYSPVEKLIKDIKAEKNIDFTRNEDEVSVLSRTFATLIKQDKNLFDILEKNKREVKETYLKDLLSGSVEEEINRNIVGDNFIYNSYVCAVISIDKYNTFTKNYSRQQQYYMKNLISQVTDEVLKSNFAAVSCNIRGGEIAVIVNVEDNLHEVQLSLMQPFSTIQQELGKVLENNFSVSIGTVHRGTQGITISYFEALAALKQKLKLGYGNIILWTEGFTDDDYYYPIKIEELLLKYLRISSFAEVQVVLNELIDDLISRSNLSSENILQIFSQILGNTVIKLLLEQRINIYDIFGVEYNVFKELASRENIYEMRDLLEEVYSRIIQYYEKLKKCDKKHMKEIISYISQNYNRDISINDVSEYVGLSYSHVRKIFKDEIGENIIEYINNIRINEAKKLLANMDINIKSIAMNLGYNNVQSFTRFFKKNEGITPGEYRSNL